LFARETLPERPSGRFGTVLGFLLVATVACAGLAYFGLWPCSFFRQFQQVAMEGEVGGVVDAIKSAELAYYDQHGHYLALPETPRPAAAADSTPVPWPADPAWAELGWTPDPWPGQGDGPGPLRGVYWVVLTPTGFAVHGICDVDEDGVLREVIATAEQNATLQRLDVH
jgi:hypothetical protein